MAENANKYIINFTGEEINKLLQLLDAAIEGMGLTTDQETAEIQALFQKLVKLNVQGSDNVLITNNGQISLQWIELNS